MAHFTMTVATLNDAFQGLERGEGRREMARILQELAEDLENGSRAKGGLYDVNGDRVGQWTWEGAPE